MFKSIKFAETKYLKSFIAFLLILSVFISVGHTSYGESIGNERNKEISEKLEKILSSDEFAEKTYQKSFFENMWEKIWRGIFDFLDKIGLSRKLGTLIGGELSPGASTGLKAFGIIVVLAIIGLILFLVYRNFRSSRKLMQKEDAELLTFLQNYEMLEKMAFDCSSQGDYRQGIRFLYLAMLIKFNELNIIRIDRSKTNRQYLLEIYESNYMGYNQVKEFTGVFNECWYGKKNTDKEKFDTWYSVYTSIMKEVTK